VGTTHGHPAALRREWIDHAIAEISAAGHRSGAARRRVIEALAEHDCCLSAQELHDQLQDDGRSVGIASVYRVIELLLGLRLVQRFDFDGGMSRYEPALPGGEHHHHLVCVTCGDVRPFDDEGLESAIHATAYSADWAIDEHDVVLRGRCPKCRT
jgi:Fur family ferric uptake transcriptional regulator